MDAQADLSPHWARSHFVGFVVRRFIYTFMIVSALGHGSSDDSDKFQFYSYKMSGSI